MGVGKSRWIYRDVGICRTSRDHPHIGRHPKGEARACIANRADSTPLARTAPVYAQAVYCVDFSTFLPKLASVVLDSAAAPGSFIHFPRQRSSCVTSMRAASEGDNRSFRISRPGVYLGTATTAQAIVQNSNGGVRMQPDRDNDACSPALGRAGGRPATFIHFESGNTLGLANGCRQGGCHSRLTERAGGRPAHFIHFPAARLRGGSAVSPALLTAAVTGA